jgi:hypothetical protein
MAEELGVSSSIRLSSVRREEISPSSTTSSNKKKKGFNLFTRNSSASEDAEDYQAVPADGRATGVGLLKQGNAAVSQAGVATTYTSITSSANDPSPFGAAYAQPTGVGVGVEPPQSNVHDDDNTVNTVRTADPHIFDANGNRAPYREGPYDCHHDEDGRLIKKRWCK